MIIAIEGIDAAGKGTQTRLLKERAEKMGLKVGMLSFPRYHQTTFAIQIAQYLNGGFGELDDIPAQFPALLYAGDRFESLSLINTLLSSTDLLIIDRYVSSNLAYQAAKVPPSEQEAFIEWLAKIEYDIYKLPEANMTLYLDLPVEAAARLLYKKKARSYTNEKADLHEKNRDYLSKCHGVYKYLAARSFRSQWVTIDCSHPTQDIRDLEDIHEAIWASIEPLL